MYLDCTFTEEDPVDQVVTNDTMVGVVTKKSLDTIMWNHVLDDVARKTVAVMAEEKYGQCISGWEYIYTTKNDTHLLIAIQPEILAKNSKCAWYKYGQINHAAIFVREGPYREENYKISESLWFSEYADFAKEFPGLYGDPDNVSPLYPSDYESCKNCGVYTNLDVNGLCDNCVYGLCYLCGGPLGNAHDCNDYPNVICSNCGWGMFTTGVGVNGIICPHCGNRVI